MQAKFLLPNGEITDIPYYKIEDYCKKICEEYIMESTENLLKFEEFKKGYSCFNPFFDFVIFELKYVLVNPLLDTNKIGCARENKFLIFSKNEYEKSTNIKDIRKVNYILLKCDDKNLGARNLDDLKLDNGFISKKGMLFDMDNHTFHEDLAKQILNQIMISNENICMDYIEKRNNSYFPACELLRDELGYIQCSCYDDNSGNILYNSDKISSIQGAYLYNIRENMDGYHLENSNDITEKTI